MTEREFRALVSLLEDDDPNIERHVEDRLLAMGVEIVPRLEAIWEEEGDSFVQTRIADIIHVIQSKSTLDALRDWKEDGGSDLLRGWFLVTRFQYPELEYISYKNEINRLVNKIWLELRSEMNLPERLFLVNKMLFRRERYRSNRQSFFNPKHYFLNGVLESRKGSPIALGLLYLIISQELDFYLKGILLPDYFILTYKDRQNEFFIDVYNKGAFFVRSDLQRFLKEMGEKENPKYFEANTKIEIITSLVHMIIKCYKQGKKAGKAEKWKEVLQILEG